MMNTYPTVKQQSLAKSKLDQHHILYSKVLLRLNQKYLSSMKLRQETNMSGMARHPKPYAMLLGKKIPIETPEQKKKRLNDSKNEEVASINKSHIMIPKVEQDESDDKININLSQKVLNDIQQHSSLKEGSNDIELAKIITNSINLKDLSKASKRLNKVFKQTDNMGKSLIHSFLNLLMK